MMYFRFHCKRIWCHINGSNCDDCYIRNPTNAALVGQVSTLKSELTKAQSKATALKFEVDRLKQSSKDAIDKQTAERLHKEIKVLKSQLAFSESATRMRSAQATSEARADKTIPDPPPPTNVHAQARAHSSMTSTTHEAHGQSTPRRRRPSVSQSSTSTSKRRRTSAPITGGAQSAFVVNPTETRAPPRRSCADPRSDVGMLAHSAGRRLLHALLATPPASECGHDCAIDARSTDANTAGSRYLSGLPGNTVPLAGALVGVGADAENSAFLRALPTLLFDPVAAPQASTPLAGSEVGIVSHDIPVCDDGVKTLLATIGAILTSKPTGAEGHRIHLEQSIRTNAACDATVSGHLPGQNPTERNSHALHVLELAVRTSASARKMLLGYQVRSMRPPRLSLAAMHAPGRADGGTALPDGNQADGAMHASLLALLTFVLRTAAGGGPPTDPGLSITASVRTCPTTSSPVRSRNAAMPDITVICLKIVESLASNAMPMNFHVFDSFIDDIGDVGAWLVTITTTPATDSVFQPDHSITHTALNVLLALVRIPKMAAKIAAAQREFAKMLLRCRMSNGHDPAAGEPVSAATAVATNWATALSVQAKVVQLLAVVYAHTRRTGDAGVGGPRAAASMGTAAPVHGDLLVAMGVLLHDSLDALEYPFLSAAVGTGSHTHPQVAVVQHLKACATLAVSMLWRNGYTHQRRPGTDIPLVEVLSRLVRFVQCNRELVRGERKECDDIFMEEFADIHELVEPPPKRRDTLSNSIDQASQAFHTEYVR
eukprot:m.1167228 g.1167228  ORF g.1167228 m.1167228 type:complete len:773 (+) comp24506_c0_seq24:642-2960(+)